MTYEEAFEELEVSVEQHDAEDGEYAKFISFKAAKLLLGKLRSSQPAATVTLPTHEGWWWEWDAEHWKMHYVWKELDQQQYGYGHCGQFVVARPGHWIHVPMPPKPAEGETP